MGTDEQEARAFKFKRPKSTPTVVVTPEGAVVNATIKWLYAQNIFCWRNQTGAWRPDGSKRAIRYGLPGSPDIIAVANGRFIGLECKSTIGHQQDNQIEFQRKLEAAGGLYLIIRSVDDLELNKDLIMGVPTSCLPDPVHSLGGLVALMASQTVCPDS